MLTINKISETESLVVFKTESEMAVTVEIKKSDLGKNINDMNVGPEPENEEDNEESEHVNEAATPSGTADRTLTEAVERRSAVGWQFAL